jgi:hypothetical protein
MKRIVYLLFMVVLSSCSSNRTEQSELSEDETENAQTTEQISTPEPEPTVITKTPLELLFEDGLQLADSAEQCASRKFAAEPRIKLVFDYLNGNKLILEEWEYSFDQSNEDLKLLDFHVFNCQTKEILLEAQYTTASYKILDVKPNLSIQINADVPTLNEGYSRQPFVIKTFKEVDTVMMVETEKIFDIPNLSSAAFSEIESTYHSRPTLEEDKDLESGDFASEKLLLELFQGAINGNESALELFENIEMKYVLDGAVSELYSDLNYLIREANK